MTEELTEGQEQESPPAEETAEGTRTGPQKYSEADLDRLVQERVATNAKKLQAEIDQEKTRREQEKLQADGKYEELFESTQKELRGVRGDLAARELAAQTRAALDKAGLSQYAGIFEGDQSTIEGRQAIIGQLGAMMQDAVAAGVNLKLSTSPPPASPGTPKALDLNAQIAAADVEAAKTGDWGESTRLKNLKLDQ